VAHERCTELVQRGGAEPFFDARGDTGLQLVRGPLRKRERDDPGRAGTVGHQLCERLRNDLGLARASRRNDLQMRTAVQHSRTRVTSSGGAAELVKLPPPFAPPSQRFSGGQLHGRGCTPHKELIVINQGRLFAL
jgi:hypothetical protein